MDRYFKRTVKGRQRAGHIIPEAFFVHSDLTTGVQLADLVAYLVSWGFRDKRMKEPRREELDDLVGQMCQLRYKTRRAVGPSQTEINVWSFASILELISSEEED